MMGNRFEITIDYRFTIGMTKPTSYRLYNQVIAYFEPYLLSPIMVKYNQLQYPEKERHIKGMEYYLFLFICLFLFYLLKSFGKMIRTSKLTY